MSFPMLWMVVNFESLIEISDMYNVEIGLISNKMKDDAERK